MNSRRCECGKRLTHRPRFIQTEPSRPEESGTLFYCPGNMGTPGHTEYVEPFKTWREKLDAGEIPR